MEKYLTDMYTSWKLNLTKTFNKSLVFDSENTDVFVVEAGSDEDKLSKYCTRHVQTDEVNEHGLRYSRGMNYGLLQL